MSDTWSEKFKDQLEARERELDLPRKLTAKDFTLYKRCVLELYERVESKVRTVPQIEVTRPVVTRSDRFRVDVQGVIDTIHSLVLRWRDRRLELVPEGINLGRNKGRVRFKHNAPGVSKFLYAALMDVADAGNPEGVAWVLLDREREEESNRRLDDAALERILEAAFLKA